MSARSHIRIENDAFLGQTARVLYVPGGDAAPVDISHCVTRATVTMAVGEPNLATLEVIFVAGRVNAELDDLIVRYVGASRLGRLWWRIAKWRRRGVRLVSVATLGSPWREWVRL